MTNEADIAAAVDKATADFGQLDVMVNNAGIVGAVGSIIETPVEAFDATMAILARAVFLGMKHAGRVMVPQRSGSIVSLASTAGVVGGLGPHVYTMAKHGVVGLTKSAASEFSQYGVRVNAVAPGPFKSRMMRATLERAGDAMNKMVPLGRIGSPEDMAGIAIYLASRAGAFVDATVIPVDGGIVGCAGTL